MNLHEESNYKAHVYYKIINYVKIILCFMAFSLPGLLAADVDRSIKLEGVENTRDLGGLETKDGP